MTETPDDDGLVERVARIIDPTSFRYHESMFSYCLAQGDDDSTAERYADETHGASMETAREIAREAIASMPIAALRAENEALRNQLASLQVAAVEYAANYLADEREDVRNCWDGAHYEAVTNLCDEIDEAARALLGSKT